MTDYCPRPVAHRLVAYRQQSDSVLSSTPPTDCLRAYGAGVVLVAMEVSDPEICFCLQELLSRTSLETQKLDLMTEVSELKLKLVGMEKEQREQEEKQRKAEVSVIH